MTDPDRDSPNFVRDTVVVGASAGGIQALRTIVRALPSPFPAAVLIVLHIGNHPSTLAAILRASGPHPVIEAADGEIVRPGHLYVAVPDRHLLLEYDRIRLSRGPRENHTRPAIDPLFRSAALTRGSRVIGALLTGRLDDGVAGLQAIRECGGVVVVQDPSSAEEPGMPTEALKSVVVDRVAPLESLAAVLAELVGQAAPASQAAPEVPVRLSREHAIALGEGAIVEELNAVGRTSKFTCPDCGGSLWQIEASGPLRFRCHTGHAYSMRTLLAVQSTQIEQALWSAVRTLQEKSMMLRQALALERGVRDDTDVGEMERRAGEYDAQARALRALIDRSRASSGGASV
ncbi:MAG TPA: chemotaxis protein CheB [Zeimonas sp.]